MDRQTILGKYRVYKNNQKVGNMKRTKFLLLTVVISLNTVLAQENIESNSSLSIMNDKYLGQSPPGDTSDCRQGIPHLPPDRQT